MTDFICFGGEDWWYHNRGHIDMQLMRRFAAHGKVVYVNSIVMQKLGIGSPGRFIEKLKRKTRSISRGLRKTSAGFWAFSPLTLPVHHIGWAKRLNAAALRFQVEMVTRRLKMHRPVVWVACPAACDAALALSRRKLVYQRTDRYEEYPNVDVDVIAKYDRKLKEQADLTIFVNRLLYDEEHDKCRRAFYLDHGVDYALFAESPCSDSVPGDIAGIKHPIIGFFGGIDNHTFDVEFAEKVAGLMSEVNFVFVGKVSADCTALSARSNVHMLGQKPYDRIPGYGRCFDVAIMPWRQNRWIQACNPIKLKEYLALGKPVVSTPFNELDEYSGLVYQGRTPEDFAEAIELALAEDSAELAEMRRHKVKNQTWDSKARLALDVLFESKEAVYD